MAKHDSDTTRPKSGTTAAASGAMTANAMEQRVVAFAEQLGRIAGTVHAKAEGWMNRDILYEQIASVRDAAVDLLEHLPIGVAGDAVKKPEAEVSRGPNRGRSGGVVDAPGKRHRRPMPPDARAKTVNTQAAKMRTAKTRVKTARRRGHE